MKLPTFEWKNLMPLLVLLLQEEVHGMAAQDQEAVLEADLDPLDVTKLFTN